MSVVLTLKSIYRDYSALRLPRILSSIRESLSLKLLARIADIYVVHTKRVLDQAASIGIDKDKLRLIPTGIDVPTQEVTKSFARQKLRLPQDASILLMFGVMRSEKGILELLSLIPHLPEKTYLLLAGEDWTKGRIEEKINSLNTKDKVFYKPGYIQSSDIQYYFRASDAVVIHHRPDFTGESGVMLQAVQYGIPILARSDCSTSIIVKNHRIGFIYENTGASFRSIVSKLRLLSEAEKDVLGQSINTFRQEHTWDKIVRNYIDVYRELIR